MDKAVEFAFVAGRNRNHGLAVADRDLGIGIDDARPLGRGQYGLQALGRLPFALADGAADLLQGGRSVVLHVAEAVENAVDALHDLGERRNAPRTGMEGRVALLAADDERDDAADRSQRPAQCHDLLHVEERTLDAQFGDDVIDIGVLAPGEIVLHVQHEAHFVGECQPPFDLARRGRKALRSEPLAGGTHRATSCDLFAEPVETYLLLECSRVNHGIEVMFKYRPPFRSGRVTPTAFGHVCKSDPPPNPLLGGDLSQRTQNYDRKRQRTAHRMQPEKTYFSLFSESRSALAAALAALRSAFSCIFSGLRPKSEKCT